jgi:hypothetical protein
MPSLKQELRLALPVWAITVLLPAPAAITSRNGGLGLVYFFLASIGMVAAIFWRDFPTSADDQRHHRVAWNTKLAAAAISLVTAWIIFAGMCLPLSPRDATVSPTLAFLGLVPALCVTPWMLAVTRNPFIAAVFTMTLVACMKMLGCILVVLVYGWDASERGYTALPWTDPNLLVWSFFAFTAVLSAIGLCKGAAQFRLLADDQAGLAGVKA